MKLREVFYSSITGDWITSEITCLSRNLISIYMTRRLFHCNWTCSCNYNCKRSCSCKRG